MGHCEDCPSSGTTEKEGSRAETGSPCLSPHQPKPVHCQAGLILPLRTPLLSSSTLAWTNSFPQLPLLSAQGALHGAKIIANSWPKNPSGFTFSIFSKRNDKMFEAVGKGPSAVLPSRLTPFPNSPGSGKTAPLDSSDSVPSFIFFLFSYRGPSDRWAYIPEDSHPSSGSAWNHTPPRSLPGPKGCISPIHVATGPCFFHFMSCRFLTSALPLGSWGGSTMADTFSTASSVPRP